MTLGAYREVYQQSTQFCLAPDHSCVLTIVQTGQLGSSRTGRLWEFPGWAPPTHPSSLSEGTGVNVPAPQPQLGSSPKIRSPPRQRQNLEICLRLWVPRSCGYSGGDYCPWQWGSNLYSPQVKIHSQNRVFWGHLLVSLMGSCDVRIKPGSLHAACAQSFQQLPVPAGAILGVLPHP